MKVVLEWDGGDSVEDFDKFKRALDSNDDNFDLLDSIYWELDYGEGESVHHTKYGDVIIKQYVDVAIKQQLEEMSNKMGIKEFYTKKYAEDYLGRSINPSASFEDLYKILQDKKDVRDLKKAVDDLIGVDDGLMRVLILEELARRKGVSYGDIFDLEIGAAEPESYRETGGGCKVDDGTPVYRRNKMERKKIITAIISTLLAMLALLVVLSVKGGLR